MGKHIKYEVVIIGGGVIGCSIAWRLGQAGRSVVVVERGEIGREASQAAGGMLAPLAEANEADEFFHLAVASRLIYPEFARELQEASGVDIEYRSEGTLYLALTDEDEEELDRRWRWEQAAGLNVKRLQADCVRKLEPGVNPRIRWALKFPDDHQVNNRHLTRALHLAAKSAGVEFLTQTEAQQLLTEGWTAPRRIRGVKTSRGELGCATVIVAGGSWSSLLPLADGQTLDAFTVEPVRGQMLAVEMPEPPISHVVYTRRGYVIPRLGGFLIAGATTEQAGYDKRVTAGGIASIIEQAVEILPGLSRAAMIEMWAGLRPRTLDDRPILGADPLIEGLVYATAHYRNGILLTPITAQAISQLIVDGESRFNLAPFSISRFRPRA
ncbi:MAG TPA: glycine oxidase ThiO [Blastocatellia bacterium]|nr:glycine oxidase ThiO [Blastocatellia bacterium]